MQSVIGRFSLTVWLFVSTVGCACDAGRGNVPGVVRVVIRIVDVSEIGREESHGYLARKVRALMEQEMRCKRFRKTLVQCGGLRELREVFDAVVDFARCGM